MAVERAGEEGGPARRGREHVHQLRRAPERGDRPAVPHRLAERRQVRRHACDRLVATQRMTEARDHLVEDEDGSVPRRELAQPLEEPLLGQHRTDVVRDRLEDDGRDVVVGQRALDVVGVVEAADDRRLGDLGEDTLRKRVAAPDVLRQRDDVHRDRVVPAVVAALELDHVAAARRRARDADRVEGRLAPCLGEEHALDRRDELAEPLRKLDLDRRHADTHQPDGARRRGDRGVDVGIVVPEERRPEGRVVVGVRPALGVGERRAARGRDDEVFEARDAPLSAVDAARDDGGGTRGEIGVWGDGHVASVLVSQLTR